MNVKRLVVMTFLLVAAISATAALKDTVEKDFASRSTDKQVSGVMSKVAKMNMNADEQLAMKFLYSYMPLPDMTDYSVDFYGVGQQGS